MIPSAKKPTTTKLGRNWIRPPNTMIKKGSKNSPQRLSYWTDTDGKVKLFTQGELATCNILNNLNFILTRALLLMDILKTLDEDTKIGNLTRQDYAHFEASSTSVFNRFISLMAAVPDVSFGEFLNFISTGNDPEKLKTIGQKILKEVVNNKNDHITKFYTSDRFRQD